MIGSITQPEFYAMVGQPVFQIATIMWIPIKSEANERGNWRAHASRRKSARETARDTVATMMQVNQLDLRGLVIYVVLDRMGGGKMDTDNLYGAFKHVRDGIAKALNIDDGDESRLRFYVDQRPNRKAEQSVRMTIIGARQ